MTIRGIDLTDDEIGLLELCGHGHTHRPGDRPGENFEVMIGRLRRLRDLGLIRLEEGRIMKGQAGRYLMAGPCDLTEAGRRVLDEDRRLGPR